MTDPEFQIGDAVRLKSGGPRMTIADLTDVDGEPQVVCVWYDQYHREARRSYPASSMKLDRESPPDLAAPQSFP
jgi:uncharacterized protein YodC (DUF2158 family)